MSHWGNVSQVHGDWGFNEPTRSYLLNGGFHVPAGYGTTPDAFIGRQPKQSGFSLFRAVGNFIKGGVVNTIKGIFSVKGILTMAAAGALIAVTGGAALPFLAAAGIGIGGYQAIKGVLNAASLYAGGDTAGAEKAFEGIGSGVVTALLSVLGARAAYRGGHVKTAIPVKGKMVTAQQATGVDGLFASTRATVRQLFADVTGKSSVYSRIGTNGKPTMMSHQIGNSLKPVNLFESARTNLTNKLGTFTTGIRARYLEAQQKGSLLEGVKHLFLPIKQRGQQYFDSVKAHAYTTADDAGTIITPGEGVSRSAAFQATMQNNPVARFLQGKAQSGQLQIAGAGVTQAGKTAGEGFDQY